MAKLLLIALALGALVWGGITGYNWFQQDQKTSAAVQQVGPPMAAEVDECQQRLKSFYAGWNAYRKAHRGQDPPSIEALLPKYIRSADLLVCPTAARYQKHNKPLLHGEIKVNGKETPVTYGFRWLSANNGIMLKREGEKAPLITCASHQEAVSRFIYGKDPDTFECPPGEAARLEKAGVMWKLLTLQRDGNIRQEASM